MARPRDDHRHRYSPARDYPVVQTAVLVSAVIVVFINWTVDLLYRWLDPRIQ